MNDDRLLHGLTDREVEALIWGPPCSCGSAAEHEQACERDDAIAQDDE